MSSTPVALSHDEAERLRQILNQHDKANLHGSAFDLHKPPVKPYRHQEFPKVVYHHASSKPSRDKIKVNKEGNEELIHVPAQFASKIVNSPDELMDALAAGYSEKPPVLQHISALPADEGEEPEVDDSPDLNKMTRKQLLAHAKDEHGLELDPATKKGDILAAIQDAKDEQ